MRTYHGERTERGCEVTVDGRPLRVRSDLSGNATTAFDWGYAGGGQLSVALLSDFLGDDRTAERLTEAFELRVVAELPHDSWTLTDYEFAAVLAPLGWLGSGRPAGGRGEGAGGTLAAFGDIPSAPAGAIRPRPAPATL